MAPSYTGGSSADYERQQREYWRAQEAARMEQQRRQDMNDEQRRRDEEASKRNHSIDGGAPSSGTPPTYRGGSQGTDMRALGRAMLREPPLPVERNVLLGSWRLEGAGQQNRVLEFGLTGKGATPGMGELMGYMKSIESGQLACDMSFGRGMTFTPTTFSSGGAAGIAGGPVAYRSRKRQVIVAIPGDSRANPMLFEVVGPDRIVSMIGGCALVRVGAPAANAAANATAAPSGARTAAAGPSAQRSSTALQTAGAAGVVVQDGAAFRCGDGSLLHVSLCQGNADDATCKLTELHRPGLQMGKPARRADIAARVNGCEAGGIRYGKDDKPMFVP
jgi:hypothetical protein